jgi:hypothetical protein
MRQTLRATDIQLLPFMADDIDADPERICDKLELELDVLEESVDGDQMIRQILRDTLDSEAKPA